jgi:hypothetical protein
MDDLRERLDDIEAFVPPDLWDDIEGRASHTVIDRTPEYQATPSAGRRVTAGIVAAAIFFIVAGFAWLGLRQLTPGPPASDQPSNREARISIPRPQAMAAGSGAVWVVSGTQGGQQQLWRIDTATNGARLILGTRGVFTTPAVGEGAVWLITCRASSTQECATTWLLKIDPGSGHILARAKLPSPGEVTAGLGFVWVAVNGELLKVDPVSLRIVARVPGRFGEPGVASGYLWGLGGGGRGLRRVDPSTGLDRRVEGVRGDCLLLASETSVWVTSCGGRPGAGPNHLFAVDPSTGRIQYRLPFEFGGLSYDGDHLWVSRSTESGASLEQLDPSTGMPTGIVVQVSAEAQPWIDHRRIGSPFIDSVIGSGSFWLSQVDLNDVVRVPVPGT